MITPEGITDPFIIGTGVLQSDPLAPFLFIICPDYTLHISITDVEGLTLRCYHSCWYPAEVLKDLDYVDDI